MNSFNWENCRRPNGTLDLVQALLDALPEMRGITRTAKAIEYLAEVEDLTPIRSRQAAAIAVAHAMSMVRHNV